MTTDKRQRGPLAVLVQGMEQEAKKEFLESWKSAQWLTDPMTDALKSKKASLLKELVYGPTSPGDGS